MNLDDKKILAEFVGHKPLEKTVRITLTPQGGYELLPWEKYNPDTNPEQFKEVLERLSYPEILEINGKLSKLFTHDQFEMYGIKFLKWALDHILEVIEAALEVIKKGGKK